MIRVQRPFWVALGLLLLAIVGVVESSHPEIFVRMIYFCALLMVGSLVWTYFSLRKLGIRRSARVLRQQVGQIFDERFEVLNQSRWGRLWLEVRDLSVLPGKSGSRVLSWVGPRQLRFYSAYTWLDRRGAFSLGPTEIRSGDPFGLFSVSARFEAEKSLLVLPFMAELKSFPLPSGFLPGGRALRRKTKEVTPYAAGVREYAPGDALSRIHWPTTARRDRMMVKEFEQDPQADVWIFIDAMESMQLQQLDQRAAPKVDQLWLWRNRLEVSIPPDTFEYAICSAASISNYFIRQGRSVGLASAGKTMTVLAAERGERQLGKLLEFLSFLNADGTLPLLGAVDVLSSQMARGSLVVLITPTYDATQQTAVEALLQRHFNPVVVLIDRESFGGGPSNAQMLSYLQLRSVPTLVVSNGCDLQTCLQRVY